MTSRSIVVNGRPRSFDDERLVDVVRALGVDPDRAGIAVAVNEHIVPRGQWPRWTLRDGDRVEVVGAVQGG